MTLLNGFQIALFSVFLTLKLAGLIDWSWWYIILPLWADLVIIIPARFIRHLTKPSEFSRTEE